MHIDPTSTEGLAYIADHLGATYDADAYEAFLESDLGLIRATSGAFEKSFSGPILENRHNDTAL